jgi:endonuclease G
MPSTPLPDRSRELIRRAAERGNPIFRELGLVPDDVATAFKAPGSSLESAQPPMFLEAIVRMAGRPPLVVRNDKVEGKTSLIEDPSDPDAFPHDIADKITGVERFLPSVGRVEFVNHPQSWGGTAWVLPSDGNDLLIVTNRHVAVAVARRTHRGDGVFIFAPTSNARYGARFNTAEDPGTPANPDRRFQVEAFTYIADDLQADVAIARLRLPDAGSVLPLSLPLADTDTDRDELVAVVGYPAADPYRNDPTAMERYFRSLYDVKRFAPGRITAAAAGEVLSHDCTTLGGNSGSPVISLERDAVVGLHFAGQYGIANSAVRASTLRALMAGERGLVPGTAMPGEDQERRDPQRPAEHFDGRPGYDRHFLRVADVPLPTLPAHLALARPSDATDTRPHELRYRHFSVLYSAAQKMPALCALNIDGAQMHPLKRRSISWGKDMRLPEAIQLGTDDYADPEIDRGHLVRRAATNWGPDADVAKQSDADSFHYTVCAPQHSGLNRSQEMWLGLEDYILSSTVTHGFRANVMAGPVFAPDDPPLETSGATIPMAYWKLVIMLAEDEDEVLRPHATAYVLSQGPLIHDMLDRRGRSESVEGFAFGAFRTFQVRIGDLAETLGYDFGDLPRYDPLARRVDRSEAAVLPVRPVDSPEDIVL